MWGFRKRARKESDCPQCDTLRAYATGKLFGRANEAVFLHIKHCSRCLRALGDIQRVPDPREIIGPQAGWRRLLERLRSR